LQAVNYTRPLCCGIDGDGLFDPDIVTFYGKSNTGARMQLWQAFTPVERALRALPKAVQSPANPSFRLIETLRDTEQPSRRRKQPDTRHFDCRT